ncbi:MAG TPA: SRPBCC domain-containing protein [Blastocatellia bacterium]
MRLPNATQRNFFVTVAAVALAFILLQPAASADVADSGPGGFTVKVTAHIHAAPSDVYQRLVHNIGDWWSPAHTFSGDPHNLKIDERPQGCFCETLKTGAVRHMEVIYYEPGKVLRMSGGMGPLQALPVTVVATFTLAPDSDGTRLELVYTLGGYSPQGLAGLAPILDRVMTEQIGRLKSYVETGKPSA